MKEILEALAGRFGSLREVELRLQNAAGFGAAGFRAGGFKPTGFDAPQFNGTGGGQSDDGVVEFLLSLDLARKEFFREFETAGQKCVVFEREKLLEVLNLREFWQDSQNERRYKSYSKFGKSLGNKIGLFSGKKFLKQYDDVVLSFPFKDCVLKGAQNRDDQKSDEVFFNEIIAKKEIDVLFSPKAIGKFEIFGEIDSIRGDSRTLSVVGVVGEVEGEEGATSEFKPLRPLAKNQNKQEGFNLQDSTQFQKIAAYLQSSPNLLIKANNLIALHSIVGEYRGKVKCIYIDPPYNTGNDSFCYNDRFTHSAYLCFMKNRLEIAREFLSDDGVIFIQCDDNEQAYLKVLCDEVFGRGEFVANLVWNSINSVLKQSKLVRKEHEHILAYAKNKDSLVFARLENTMEFSNPDNDPKGAWFSSNAAAPNQDSPKNRFAIELPNGEKCLRSWKFSYEDFVGGKVNLYFKGGNVPRLKIYESECNNFSSVMPSILTGLGSITTAKQEIKNLFSESGDTDSPLFTTPKPEALLKRILEISTRENDLILDFFAGSGTTLAVAHKMGRRYIGIEQMDYIETITKERLKKVIAGEQGGISKVVGWKPQVAAQDSPDSRDLFTDSPQNPLPDSLQDSPKPRQNAFLYLELMPLNAVYKDKIRAAESEAELEALYDDLREKAFLDYRADLKKWLVDGDFKALNLADKKRLLAAALDENMDYVLYADMEDPSYGVDAGLIALNKLFYKTQQK